MVAMADVWGRWLAAIAPPAGGPALYLDVGFMPVPVLRPFVGAYYTHWFVNDLADQNGVGGRVGASFGPIQLSATYDRALNCETNCDSWSPQVAFGMSL